MGKKLKAPRGFFSLIKTKNKVVRCKLILVFSLFLFVLISLVFLIENLAEKRSAMRRMELEEELSGDSRKIDSLILKELYKNLDGVENEGLIESSKFNVTSDSSGKFRIENVSHFPFAQTDWQAVHSGNSDKFYVYSAYLSHDPRFFIRVIGVTITKPRTKRVKCVYYGKNGHELTSVKGTFQVIRENWNLKYSACFVLCPLYDEMAQTYPFYISILPPDAERPQDVKNVIKIEHKNEDENNVDKIPFSVCVKPIHFNYDDVLRFIEWIEFHKLMGVRHFTFYNHSIGPNVNCLLQKVYRDIVKVLPWTLPFTSQKEIRTEGLFAALNDCIYRHRGHSKYLILVDLDEMIVPRKVVHYSQLIQQLVSLSPKEAGAYSVQNAFFYLNWPDTEKVPQNNKYSANSLEETLSKRLVSLRKMRRRSRLHPHKQRSKYICDPERVVEAGNHFVWEMVKGYTTFLVPPHLASLHHYRSCEYGENMCGKTPSLIDKSMEVFGNDLILSSALYLKQLSYACSFNISKLFIKDK